MKPKIKPKALLLALLFPFFLASAHGQQKPLDVGIRFQKTLDMYYENGLTAQYALSERWAVGAHYISSRLGSAMGSNAIKQDNIFVSGAYLFRPQRSLRPFVRANVGFFRADYEAEIFDNLPNTSPLASLETGLTYPITPPLKVTGSVGYNAITGDGTKGPGTLFPVFYQLSFTWNMFNQTAP
ncbi:outer membrane beta-barrel protein [Pontibacter beigongshangensis]|uniref:outer membrane beta-barrel protein n=1 Tax=Pontibacter beigongshangensis TaxID=2574733 RepID=UPI00165035FC|nr:outer membrane beta-barrel protein [Pontibacter beigongshangensis]